MTRKSLSISKNLDTTKVFFTQHSKKLDHLIKKHILTVLLRQVQLNLLKEGWFKICRVILWGIVNINGTRPIDRFGLSFVKSKKKPNLFTWRDLLSPPFVLFLSCSLCGYWAFHFNWRKYVIGIEKIYIFVCKVKCPL